MAATLVLSFRAIHKSPAFAALYEFEEVISEVLDAEILRLENSNLDRRLSISRTIYQTGRAAHLNQRRAERLACPPITASVADRYDLVVCVLTNFFDLFTLHQVKGWAELDCPRICFISEPWPTNLSLRSAKLEPTDGFTHWFAGLQCGVEPLAELAHGDVHYLPMGVDTLRFSPVNMDDPRPIRVANIGRRDATLHGVLRASADCPENPWWYWHDTLTSSTALDPIGHRRSIANSFAATSFSVTNAAKFDQPYVIGGNLEVPGRFYEAIASGAVMIGSAPKTQVEGTGLIVEAGVSDLEIMSVIAELESDQTALSLRRRQGVETALRHHDWAHRISEILAIAGLGHTPALDARLQRLDDRRAQLLD